MGEGSPKQKGKVDHISNTIHAFCNAHLNVPSQVCTTNIDGHKSQSRCVAVQAAPKQLFGQKANSYGLTRRAIGDNRLCEAITLPLLPCVYRSGRLNGHFSPSNGWT